MSIFPTSRKLASQVASGDVSAREVVERSLSQMAACESDVNAVAVPLDKMARQAAARIDGLVARGEDPGPLAGVPFTIKECFHVRGTRHTMGREQSTVTAQRNSPIVERLIRAGAIPVAKTNLSQLMLLYETDNPLYGRTNHPLRADRSPGGSGGGDAAALGAGYACFSVGTDMGGSIRQPAHSVGLCGFMPTTNRLETRGVERILPGMTPVALQAGVLGRTVEDVRAAMEVLSSDRWDDGCFSAPWSTETHPLDTLRVGYWETDDYFPSCPTVRRAVRESVTRLQDAGVHVQPISPPSHRDALHMYCAIFGSDGGQRIRDRLAGESVDWRIKPLLRLGRLPRIVRNVIAKVYAAIGDRRMAGILSHSYRCSASTLWQLTEAISEFRQEFLARMQVLQLDAIVCPPHATVAFKHGASHNMLPAASYSMLANVLGAPAGVARVTEVRDDEQTMAINPSFHTDRDALANLEGAAGLPCGAQVMGAPWKDEIVLQLLDVIEATCPQHSRQRALVGV